MQGAPRNRNNSFSILMVCPQFWPMVGGYERAAERLSASLVAKGHKVTVIAERRQTIWPKREVRDGYEVCRLWCIYRKRLHAITSLISFFIFLFSNGKHYNVWHVHQYGYHAVVATAMGKLMRRPVMLKLTSSGPQGLTPSIKSLPLPKICSRILREVHAVVATTKETAQEAVDFGIPPSRVHIIGNPVDAENFFPRTEREKSDIKKTLGINAKGVVLFVGRLAPAKNHLGLLKAWKIAVSRLKEDWILVLVGDGPMRREIERWVKENDLLPYVLLTGSRSNVESWMAASDIFVIPSHNEGLSNAMLEAMASGLPVIASQVSGTGDILNQSGAGIVVPHGRPDALAAAIFELSSDREKRCSMGRAGRAIIKERFDISKIAQKYVSLYSALRSSLKIN